MGNFNYCEYRGVVITAVKSLHLQAEKVLGLSVSA